MQYLQVYINRNLLNSWAGPSAKLNYGRGLWPCCRPPSVYVRSMCNSRFYIRQFLLAGWLAGRLAGSILVPVLVPVPLLVPVPVPVLVVCFWIQDPGFLNY